MNDGFLIEGMYAGAPETGCFELERGSISTD